MKQLSLFEMFDMPGGPKEGAIYDNKKHLMGGVLGFNDIAPDQYVWLNMSTSKETTYLCVYVHDIVTMPDGKRAIRYTAGRDEAHVLPENVFGMSPKNGYGWARAMRLK